MRIERSEFGHEYGQGVYRFGYCEYAYSEPGDAPAELYANGWLPHTADPAVKNRFYMARGARVVLAKYAFTSENRRIAKRFDSKFTVSRITPEQVTEDIRTLFLTYFAERHGPRVMPEARLQSIFELPLPLELVVYKKDEVVTAAVLEIGDASFGHIYYSAYDVSLINQSLGMWLMLDVARQAKAAGREHYYLGTVYGEKALYKANLEPIEFWDGSTWNPDIAALKTLARSDSK
jgi:arginyl-tRNA--protein-N-Asp/Glu arginylyltransferase